MTANYEELGFKVSAEVMPKTCTICPFWIVNTKTFESGSCFITGREIPIDGQQDKKRMNDCPIIEEKEE